MGMWNLNRIQVESSNLNSVGYDDETNILEIEFKDNSIYQYSNVPEYIYNELLTADSKGSYLHKNIKGKFNYQRIT